jgi:hypothetical protein
MEVSGLKECWDTLKSQYGAKNNAQRFIIRNKFSHLQMEERASVGTFLQGVRELLNQMAEFEDKLDANILVEQIINVLLQSYETFVHVISSEKELATLKELIGKLQLEENRSQNKS